MGESSFWYRPTRVVPDQRPLNGRCCTTVLLCSDERRYSDADDDVWISAAADDDDDDGFSGGCQMHRVLIADRRQLRFECDHGQKRVHIKRNLLPNLR